MEVHAVLFTQRWNRVMMPFLELFLSFSNIWLLTTFSLSAHLLGGLMCLILAIINSAAVSGSGGAGSSLRLVLFPSTRHPRVVAPSDSGFIFSSWGNVLTVLCGDRVAAHSHQQWPGLGMLCGLHSLTGLSCHLVVVLMSSLVMLNLFTWAWGLYAKSYQQNKDKYRRRISFECGTENKNPVLLSELNQNRPCWTTGMVVGRGWQAVWPSVALGEWCSVRRDMAASVGRMWIHSPKCHVV